MAIGEFFQRIMPFKNLLEKGSLPKGNAIPKNADLDKVSYIVNEFDRALDFYREDRDRENDCWRMYSGLNNGQWDSQAVSTLAQEGRHAPQFNFIRNKVDGLVGNFVKNWFDVDFSPIEGDSSNLTKVLSSLYYSDKELMDWNESYLQFLTDFLVFRGIEEMVVSTKYHPLGNIGFERIIPGHLITDPNWVTYNGWELKRAWKIAYYDAQELMDKFDTKADLIKQQIAILQHSGNQYDSSDFDTGNLPNIDLNVTYGSKFRVIQKHCIKQVKDKQEVVVATGDVVPQGSDDYKREWVAINNIDMSLGVMTRESTRDVYYRNTVCDTLGVELEDVTPIIQIGRLPFFISSSCRVNGKDSGIPEILKDSQQTLNKRMSLIDDMISKSANNSALIDPSVVNNDASKMNEIEENWNRSGYKGWSHPGALASGRQYTMEFPKAQYDANVVNNATMMLDLADRISKTPDAMDGRSAGSEDNGIFFARRQQQGEINMTPMLKILENHWNQKGEAYMLAAQILYSGVYREFNIPKQGTVAINEEYQDLEGTKIRNDISKLPRHKVVITQSPQGTTQREVDRAINSELLRFLPENAPISRAVAVKNVMRTLNMSTEERREYEEAAKTEQLLAEKSVIAQIANMDMTIAQIQAQLQQAQQPQMPQPGAEQGAPEGQQPPPEQQQAAPEGQPSPEMMAQMLAQVQ